MGLYVLKYPSGRLLTPLARALRRVHPDVVSYLAVALAPLTAACYIYGADWPVLLLAAIGLILLRMALNTLDGVLAIQRGNLSLRGEIVNALPDRYSDIVLVVGIGLSPMCDVSLAMAAVASMLLVSYTGMFGKALGVEWQHHGPLGKVERLICVMAFTLAAFFHVRIGRGPWVLMGWALTPLDCCMLTFGVLAQVTVANRTRGMLRQVARLEWRQAARGRTWGGRALVVYDSATGNTEKVARAIAESLHADLKRVDEVEGSEAVDGYDLVVIGTPVIRSRPSGKVAAFLARNPGLRSYAAFATYGAPVWGPIAVRWCLARIERAAPARPIAKFVCKGRHYRFNTYKGRPNDNDLLGAFLFGMRLAKRRTKSA